MDRIFDNFGRDFERSLSLFPAMGVPSLSAPTIACDITDEGNRFLVHANIPGVHKDEVKLNMTENAVEISAEHKEEHEKKKDYVRKERKEVSYYRILSLPEKVIPSKAKMNNGILNIEIPKLSPAPKPKGSSIQVQ